MNSIYEKTKEEKIEKIHQLNKNLDSDNDEEIEIEKQMKTENINTNKLINGK